ncbi:hypothetical protein Nepgr_023617 [Nepenthes gracilis]|uniref:ELMO domain-containing protein n=1 Tax=Nepenthes gracilis TaxID=150966 RepID=A0AAD3T2S3_NEPGR|nr:hypothetical protein Nepgr_023617 [Nepenthes gracilis]
MNKKGYGGAEVEYIRRYHKHELADHQCSSLLIKHIRAAIHPGALRALWNAAFPGKTLHGLISEQWKEMGWQGKDPSTDFRASATSTMEGRSLGSNSRHPRAS